MLVQGEQNAGKTMSSDARRSSRRWAFNDAQTGLIEEIRGPKPDIHQLKPNAYMCPTAYSHHADGLQS